MLSSSELGMNSCQMARDPFPFCVDGERRGGGALFSWTVRCRQESVFGLGRWELVCSYQLAALGKLLWISLGLTALVARSVVSQLFAAHGHQAPAPSMEEFRQEHKWSLRFPYACRAFVWSLLFPFYGVGPLRFCHPRSYSLGKWVDSGLEHSWCDSGPQHLFCACLFEGAFLLISQNSGLCSSSSNKL